MTKASVRSFYSGNEGSGRRCDVVSDDSHYTFIVTRCKSRSKRRKRTHKLCELFVTDAAVSSLEALGVDDTALCVDVTETDGCQDLHRCGFLEVALI